MNVLAAMATGKVKEYMSLTAAMATGKGKGYMSVGVLGYGGM